MAAHEAAKRPVPIVVNSMDCADLNDGSRGTVRTLLVLGVHTPFKWVARRGRVLLVFVLAGEMC